MAACASSWLICINDSSGRGHDGHQSHAWRISRPQRVSVRPAGGGPIRGAAGGPGGLKGTRDWCSCKEFTDSACGCCLDAACGGADVLQRQRIQPSDQNPTDSDCSYKAGPRQSHARAPAAALEPRLCATSAGGVITPTPSLRGLNMHGAVVLTLETVGCGAASLAVCFETRGCGVATANRLWPAGGRREDANVSSRTALRGLGVGEGGNPRSFRRGAG